MYIVCAALTENMGEDDFAEVAVDTETKMILVEDNRIAITHPDHMLWPNQEITKLDYIKYLLRSAPHFVPFTRERLLMIWLYPHGFNGIKIEKRSVPRNAPGWVTRTFYKEKERMLLNDLSTLVWAVNYGAIEFHVPFDRHDRSDFPTELMFDLDPFARMGFEQVRETSVYLKQVLDSLGLTSFVKLSGKRGIHVLVPIHSEYSFEKTRQINAFVARYMAEKHPESVTLERNKDKRGDRIYLDYLQLWRGRTMIIPYGVRATELATVSAPVEWEEIEKGVDPCDFTIPKMGKRFEEKGDLWEGYSQSREENMKSLGKIFDFMKRHRSY